MKTTDNVSKYGLTALSETESMDVNGGSGVWETLGFVIGVTLKTIYVFGKAAAEYQSGLPPHLKK